MPSRWASDPKCSDCPRRKTAARANLKRCATCERKAKRTARAKAHGSHVEKTYGLTADEYWALYRYQHGRCYICRRATGASKRLAVDHDHTCSLGHPKNVGCRFCVRGLVDSLCNVYIGRMHDDPTVGLRFHEYLTDPPYQRMRAEQP